MGGLYYSTSQSSVLIGSKIKATGARTGVQLESTYQVESTIVATKSFKIAGFSKANFNIAYTMGAAETANSVEIKLEHSPDNINWYRYVTDTTTGGTSTLVNREWTYVGINAALAEFTLPVDIFDQYLRVSIKETGVASAKGALFCEVTLLGQ